jgi:hypothetical protein
MMHNRNTRQAAWLSALLPLTDGWTYQIGHTAGDLKRAPAISEQFAAIMAHCREVEGRAPAATAAGTVAPKPLLLGGFCFLVSVVKGQPEFGRARVLDEQHRYEAWLKRDPRIVGYVRFVGFLPREPFSDLTGRELAEVAPDSQPASRGEGAAAQPVTPPATGPAQK